MSNKKGTDFETKLAKLFLPWPSNVHFKPVVFERGWPPRDSSNMQKKAQYLSESAHMHRMS